MRRMICLRSRGPGASSRVAVLAGQMGEEPSAPHRFLFLVLDAARLIAREQFVHPIELRRQLSDPSPEKGLPSTRCDIAPGGVLARPPADSEASAAGPPPIAEAAATGAAPRVLALAGVVSGSRSLGRSLATAPASSRARSGSHRTGSVVSRHRSTPFLTWVLLVASLGKSRARSETPGTTST